MNLGGLALNAFGGAVKELEVRRKEDVRAVFRQDSVISALLISAPAAVLSTLLVFSSPYFHSTLITCSLRDTPEYGLQHDEDFRSYRYDYSYFDYTFIQGYCYANMYDYKVNSTGYVDKDTKESLVFLKLYPYVLATFSIFGAATKGIWELHNRRASPHLSLLVDGIEEAVSELLAGLAHIYQKMEKKRKMNETCLRLNPLSKRRKNGLKRGRSESLPDVNDETDFSEISVPGKNVKRQRLKIDQREAAYDIREYSKQLKDQLESIWKHHDTKTKFVELEDMMKSKANSYKLTGWIFCFRFIALMVTVGCGTATYYYYCLKLPRHKYFNCYLPETYWYSHFGVDGNDDRQVWKTTKCYIKSTVFWEYTSYALFIFYATCVCYQLYAHVRNTKDWKKSFKMIQCMPLQATDMVALYERSDLHCIMALANENSRTRETIWAGDKVTAALSSDEMYKFLPVMMEMIIWKSSDENVEGLVKNILKKEEK